MFSPMFIFGVTPGSFDNTNGNQNSFLLTPKLSFTADCKATCPGKRPMYRPASEIMSSRRYLVNTI